MRHPLPVKGLRTTALPTSAPTCRAAARATLAAALTAGLLAGAVAPAQAALVASTDSTVTAPTTTSTLIASDSFARTVTGGWGTASLGGQWVTGSTGTYSVASGAARQVVAIGQTAVSHLDEVSSAATDVRVDVALNRPAGTGPVAQASVLGRSVAGVGDYRARLVVTTAGTLELQVVRQSTVLQQVALGGLAYASGTRMSVRVEVTGAAPTTVRAKAWKAGTTEPAAWQVTATDSTAGLQQAGRVGLSTSLPVSGTSLTAAYYGLRVSSLLPPNVLPTAAFDAAAEDLAVSLDASASSDTDGTITSYVWTHGDGTTSTGAGARASHTYAAAGTYESVLTVTDDRGGSATTSRTFTVLAPNVPPTAAFTATATDLTVALDASGSVDTDGTITSYEWTHGDGTTSTGPRASHTYPATGTYQAVLTVTDDRGGRATTSRTVSVLAPNVAPTSAFTATASGLTVAFDGAASADVDGTITSYEWTHGDGTTSTGPRTSHTYPAAGTYQSVLTVTDDRGARATSTRSVTVLAPRVAALQPFASTSVWNTAIGSGATFEAKGGPMISSFLTAKPVINRATWSTPVYTAKTTDVLATLRSVRTNQSWTIRIPADATGALGSGGYTDGHATIIQPDGRTSYDAYKLVKVSATVWEAQLVRVIDLHGTGTHLGVRAAGTPMLAGLIRAHEVRDRKIDHAVAIAVPNTVLKSGFVWPAKSQDTDGATAYTGQVPMGSLLAIPGSVNLSTLTLSPEGLALAKALQNYGAYVVDRGGMDALYCEVDCDATATARMATDWKVLQGHLRVVTNSTATTVGGGGTPRVAPLPALS